MSELERHPFDDDPLSGAATASFNIGRRTLVAVSDGFFEMSPTFLGTVEHPVAGHEALRSVYGQSRLPLGCFFFPGLQNVLVDTGFGPAREPGVMEGGRLLGNLERHGIRPEDVHIVALDPPARGPCRVGWGCQGEAGVPECKVRTGSR